MLLLIIRDKSEDLYQEHRITALQAFEVAILLENITIILQTNIDLIKREELEELASKMFKQLLSHFFAEESENCDTEMLAALKSAKQELIKMGGDCRAYIAKAQEVLNLRIKKLPKESDVPSCAFNTALTLRNQRLSTI